MASGIAGEKNMAVVVLTALGLEFRAVESLLDGVHEQTHPTGTVYGVGTLRTAPGPVSIAVVQTGAGNTPAAIEAERVISYFSPGYLIFVGVAGGLKDVSVGDVVAATKVYQYERGKADGEFRARPELVLSGYSLMQRAMATARASLWQRRLKLDPQCTRMPQAFVGPIAAGEQVVTSTDAPTFQLIRRHYGDALAVEMEGYGALRAAYANPGVQAIIIRGISDLVIGKSESDAAGSQEVAAAHAAAFMAEVLEGLALSEPAVAGVRPDDAHPGTVSTRPAGEGVASDAFSELRDALASLGATLYPKGPLEGDVWARAGGDVSRIDVSSVGRTAWYRALRTLELGGGGADISFSRLVAAMREDFPSNGELAALAAHVLAGRLS